MSDSKDIFSYGLKSGGAVSAYEDLMSQLGQPAFRAKQLSQWLWSQSVVHGASQGALSGAKKYAFSYGDMTNLPAALRAQLAELAPLQRSEIEQVQHSKDGTRKYLLRFADGTSVEAVGLPSGDEYCEKSNADTVQAKRLSVCISVQAGCALACSFCATGQADFKRNLLPGEIAEQVRVIGADFRQRVSHVVVMGQGEAFHNYDAVLAALRIINASETAGGLGIGARHITVSTAGIIKGIERFGDEPEQFTLAVSLHSAQQATRDKIMPGLRGQSIEQLGCVLVSYFEKTGRRPSLEYALIRGVNTDSAEADALISFAEKTKAHVNLIPLNETNSKLKAANQSETLDFANRLRNAGIQVTLRKRRGADIDAACGQLSQKSLR